MTSAEEKRWVIILAGPAEKNLKKVPRHDLERVRTAIDAMERNPFNGDVCKLKGSNEGFRRRVGDWRIFFDLYPAERRVVITGIERRSSTTY